MVVQTGLYLAHFLAEAQDNAQFVRFDAEKSGKTPEGERTKKNECETASAEIAAGQHAPQSVLPATEDFLQIGWSWAWRLRPGTPRAPTTAPPRSSSAAALICPRHRIRSPAPAISARLVSVGRGYRGRQAPLQRVQMPRLTGDSTSYICDQGKAGIVVGAGIVVLARYLLPDLRIDRWKHGITLRRCMHLRDFTAVGPSHRRSEVTAAANYHDFIAPALGRIRARVRERRIKTRCQYRATSDETEIARQYTIGPAGKQPSDRLMRLATHDDRAIHRDLAEMLEIRLKTPRQLSLTPDDRVVADRGNDHDFHDDVSLQGKVETARRRQKRSRGRAKKSQREYEKRCGIIRTSSQITA